MYTPSPAILENGFQVLADLELDLLGAVFELKHCQCRVQAPFSPIAGLTSKHHHLVRPPVSQRGLHLAHVWRRFVTVVLLWPPECCAYEHRRHWCRASAQETTVVQRAMQDRLARSHSLHAVAHGLRGL